MAVTADDLKAKKQDVLTKQLAAIKAANASNAARNAVQVAQGELQELQAQQQLEAEV